MSEREVAPAIAPTCQHCKFIYTFAARPDEQKRYGFGAVGYGCKFPGNEGYTKADDWCPSFFGDQVALAAAIARTGDA